MDDRYSAFRQPATSANGNGNGKAVSTPTERVSRFGHYKDLVVNFLTSRVELLRRWLDPRRNLEYECGYPQGYVEPAFYLKLYEQDPLPGRVVELFPKECFQVSPEIYEDEDPETVTAFEDALYNMCAVFAGQYSYSQTSKLTRLIEIIRRADIASGIGCYGIYLIGVDDNRDLSQPADLRPIKPKKPKKTKKLKTDAEDSTPTDNPPEGKTENRPVVAEGTELKVENGVTQNYSSYDGIPISTSQPDERPYVRDEDGNLVLPDKAPTDPLAKPPPRKGAKGTTRNLTYIQVFPEAYARVSQWDMDPNSKRFGHPTAYTVQFGAYGQGEGATMPVETKEVHWSRVVHLTDVNHHAPDNHIYAAPRQRPVLHRLLDARKVYGPAAESFYKNGIPTWVFETHPELGSVELDKQSLKDEWEQNTNSTNKMLATEGGTLKPLSTSIPDPSPHVMIHIQAICYKLGVPQRIFMGSERGELASSQDDAAWNDRIRERQNNYLTPMVIEPLIDRLIALGVLPEPEAEDGYKVWWPDLESQSDGEKSTVAGAKTTAIATFFDPAKELFTRMAEMDFWTKIMGYEEREAKQIVQNAEKEREKRKKEKEEEAVAQMALQDEQARAAAERDLEFQGKAAEQQTGLEQAAAGPKAIAEADGITDEQAVLEEAGIATNQTRNIFCKTGPGGGIDPTCGTGKTESGSSPKPVQETEAFKKHLDNALPKGVREDLYLHDLFKENGYAGLPGQKSKADVDKLVSQGWTEMYRGAPHAHQEQLRNGEIFVGKGVYGAGIYAGTGEKALQIAQGYSGGGRHVVRMVLDPSAKVASIKKIDEEMDKLGDSMRTKEKQPSPEMKATQERIAADMMKAVQTNDTASVERLTKEYQSVTNRPQAERQLLTSDESRYAVSQGYHAVYVEKEGYMVILDRSKLVIQEGQL